MRHVAAYISDVDEETWPLPPEYVYLIDFTIPPVPTDTPLPTDNPLPTEIPRPEEPISIELAESRKLWYGEYGLVATPEYVEIVQDISLACVNNSNTECDAELREKWGINALQGSYVADNCKLLGRRGGGGGVQRCPGARSNAPTFYLLCAAGRGVVCRTVIGGVRRSRRRLLLYLARFAAMSYTTDFVTEKIEEGSGLIVTRTVHEWLWGILDPLLAVLSPADAFVYSFFNATSPDARYSGQGRWAFNTGKYDVIQASNMTLYDDQTSYKWFSNYTVKVEGNSGVGQFPFYPVNGRGQTMDVMPDILLFSPDHGRAVLFRDTTEKVEFFGISTHVFEIIDETYDPNPLYDLREGFRGFINSSTWNDNAPVMYSPPHFYLVDPIWGVNFTGTPPAMSPRVWMALITHRARRSVQRTRGARPGGRRTRPSKGQHLHLH